MFEFLICLIISIFTSYGMAIALVEKGKEFPIRKYRVLLQKFIHNHIGHKWAKILLCSTCSSMWLSLLIDCILCIFMFVVFGQFCFFWPFSGFITVGFTWTAIEWLNAIDKDQNINVFIDKENNNEN